MPCVDGLVVGGTVSTPLEGPGQDRMRSGACCVLCLPAKWIDRELDVRSDPGRSPRPAVPTCPYKRGRGQAAFAGRDCGSALSRSRKGVSIGAGGGSRTRAAKVVSSRSFFSQSCRSAALASMRQLRALSSASIRSARLAIAVSPRDSGAFSVPCNTNSRTNWPTTLWTSSLRDTGGPFPLYRYQRHAERPARVAASTRSAPRAVVVSRRGREAFSMPWRTRRRPYLRSTRWTAGLRDTTGPFRLHSL